MPSSTQTTPIRTEEIGHRAPIRLLRDGLINSAGLGMISLIGLITVPLLLHGLGAETYGVWVALTSLAGLLESLDLGIDCNVTRTVAGVRANQDQSDPFITTAALLYIFAGMIGTAILIATGLGLLRFSPYTFSAPSLPVFIFAGVGFFANLNLKFVTSILEGLRRFDITNGLRFSSALLKGVGIVALMLTGGGLVQVAMWLAVISVITTLAGGMIVLRLRPHLLQRTVSTWPSLLEQIKFGIMSQVNLGFERIIWDGAPVLIAAMRGPAAVVPLYVGQKLAFTLSQLCDRSAVTVFPAAGEVGSARHPEMRGILEDGTRAVLLAGLPASVLLWILSPDILSAWISSAPEGSLGIMRVTTAAVAVYAFGAATFQAYWGVGNLRRMSLILSAAAIGGTFLTFILLPRLGAAAAAWGLLAANSISTGVLLTDACGRSINNACRMIARAMRGLLFPTCAACAVTALLRLRLHSGAVQLLICLVVAMLVYVSLLLCCGLDDDERHVLTAGVRLLLDTVRKMVKGVARWFPGAVPLWHAGSLLWELLLDPFSRSSYFDDLFSTSPDPWDYVGDIEQERYRSALRLLADVDSPGAAVEIGCAEGVFTDLLRRRCNSLLALDFSTVALGRAEVLCNHDERIRFAEWDIRKDSLDGSFDLVVCMCVLEVLRRRRDFRNARTKLVEAVSEGGYLLLGHSRQSEYQENSILGKWLLRDGKWIHQFFSEHPELETIHLDIGPTYINALFRRRVTALKSDSPAQ